MANFYLWHSYPSERCVYVDKDYVRIRLNCQLAYPTLSEAVNSWRPGGEAQLKWGTPTAIAPGAILIGAGTFTELGDGTHAVLVDVDFLDISGLNKDVSIISFGAINADGIDLTKANINLHNFAVNNGGFATNSLIRLVPPGVNANNTIESIRLTMNAGGGFGVAMVSGSGFNGIMRDCNIDVTGTTFYGLNFGTGTFGAPSWTGSIVNCDFSCSAGAKACVWMSDYNAISFYDCRFKGACEALFEMDDNANFDVYSGRIVNCLFENTAGYGINALTATAVFSPLIQDCTFVCSSVCINRPSANCRVQDCYLLSTAGNADAIDLAKTGLVVKGGRLIGNGTGLAIDTGGAITAEIAHITGRRPTAGGAGSSINAAITNSVFTSGLNVEVPSTVVI